LSRSETNQAGVAQLEREIRLMLVIKHPNSLRLFEFLHVESMDNVFFVLEYAEKGSVGAFNERSNFCNCHCSQTCDRRSRYSQGCKGV
jgi:serine/threonine protein kinase